MCPKCCASTPATTRPMALPTSPMTVMAPLALPRSDVGKSSGPYTRSAGIDAAKTTRDAGDDQQEQRRHQVDEAPRPPAEIGQLEGDRRPSGAEAGREREEAQRVRPRPGRHLLDDDDAEHHQHRLREAAAEHLAR